MSETDRLRAVQETGLFGTPAEERFDRLTRLARRLFGVQSAAVDLINHDRVWVKSSQGFDVIEACRKDSYCQYTIRHDEVTMIPDARLDERLATNPWRTTCVFYAGVPLKYHGQNVGVFCITDNAPRTLTHEELGALADLAALAEHELHLSGLSENQIRLALENERLQERASVDGLTRCWNREAILEIARREIANVAVALLDVDHFKSVNDRYGHPGGDEVLRRLADTLRQTVRPSDAVGRYGGEEFLIVFPDCAEGVVSFAERLRSKLAKSPVQFGDETIDVTVSIGTAWTEGGDLLETISLADKRLYQAKREGRNRVA